MRLVVAPAARRDLIEIGNFIAFDDPRRAASFVAEIEIMMRDVLHRPGSFPTRNDLVQGMRAARHGKYLIFFLVSPSEVLIVRVLHGARDLR